MDLDYGDIEECEDGRGISGPLISPVTPSRAHNPERSNTNAERSPDDTVEDDIVVSGVGAQVKVPFVIDTEEIFQEVKSVVVLENTKSELIVRNGTKSKVMVAEGDVENEEPIALQEKKKRFSTYERQDPYDFKLTFDDTQT